MRNVPWLAMIVSAIPLVAAPHKIEQKTFDTIALEMSGERAQELAGTPLAKENDLALYETINFLDGHRGSDEIAKLLRDEIGDAKYDKAWVDRVLTQLAAMKYVAK